MSSLSTFGVLVTPYGLLGIPGNLALRKRTGVNGMNINNANLTGLMGDINEGVTYDAVSHGALLARRA